MERTDLMAYLQTLRPPGSFEVWSNAIAQASGKPFPRQTRENYLSGRRIPEAAHLEIILVAAGKDAGDTDAWGAWVRAHRLRPPSCPVRRRSR